MIFTPILASDTTAAFLLPIVVLFWIGIVGGTIAGLVSLGLYGFKRVQRYWGVLLGALSTAAGAGGLLLLAVLTDGAELIAWAAVLTPLVIGLLDLILWKRRMPI